MRHASLFVGLVLLVGFASAPVVARDVEPRRWTPLPVGTNVLGLGFIQGAGDIALDPVLKIADATVDLRTVALSYVHAFDLLGQSARVDARLRHQDATWKGLLDVARREAVRSGPADPRIRLSVNFLGAPALRAERFRAYHAERPVNTVAGAALAISLPLGEYDDDKLLNLGENRFVFRPQMGVVHTHGPWSFELTGSVLFFTDNDEFLGDQRREQDPLFALQGHVVYSSAGGWWVSAGAAYDRGGESTVDDVAKDDSRRDLFYGLSGGLALSPRSGIKIAYVGVRTHTETGSDTDNVGVSYTFRF